MTEADRQKQGKNQDPKTLLDVVGEEYPDKVGGLFGGLSQLGKLFTMEDWINILTRSRSSYEEAWKEKNR